MNVSSTFIERECFLGCDGATWGGNRETGKTEMMHIIVGLFFIALGIWGVFDEWYYVVDFVKGSFSVLLVVVGLFGILAGAVGPRKKPDQVAITDTSKPEPEPWEDD